MTFGIGLVGVGHAAPLARRRSGGALTVYANDFLRKPYGFLPTPITSVAGDPGAIGVPTTLEDGSAVVITSAGAVFWSPQGQYDDITEPATVEIPYGTEAPVEGTDVFATDDVTLNDWTDNEDGSWTKNEGTTQQLEFNFDMVAGQVYRCYVTVAGRTAGSVTINVINASGGDIGDVTPANQGINADGEYFFDFTAPANADGIEFRSNNTFDGTVSAISVPELVVAEESILALRVLPSADVGPNLHTNGDLSGTNWVHTTGTYAHTAGSTAALAGTLAFEEGKVYEVSIEVSGWSAGDVTPAIGANAGHVLDANARDVWYIQAPSDDATFSVTPTSDFDGDVEGVRVRELLFTGDLPVPELEITAGTGEIDIQFAIPPKAGRPQNPAIGPVTGVLDAETDFGYRQENEIDSVVVEYATCADKRVHVSLKGSQWYEVWRLDSDGTDAGATFRSFITGGADDQPSRRAHVSWCSGDQGLSPNLGNYDTGAGGANDDCLILNSDPIAEHFSNVGYVLGCQWSGTSDGVVDAKMLAYVNHFDFAGGHRTFRTHDHCWAVLCNGKLTQDGDSQTAIRMQQAECHVSLFNVEVDGVRVRSIAALAAQVKGSGQFPATGAISAEYSGFAPTCDVRHTYPRLPGFIRLNVTHLIFETSAPGAGEWSPLSVPDVGVGDYMASGKRTGVSLDAGTYDIGITPCFGNQIGERVVVEGVTVN